MAPLTELDVNAGPAPSLTKDLNANQIRTRIRTFINSGEMKVGEFQNKIDVSANSYSAFMKQSGPNHGIYSKTYYNAFEFFKKRELAGLKMPRKKAKTSDTKAAAAKGKAATTDDPGKFDVGDIKLEGEERECVPIFDTCDDVRKKINAHLREPDITNAGFLREIGKTFPSPPSQGMSVASLRTFLSANGSDKHSHSPIFYAGYVYFEKLRLKNKKAKSAKRTEMEKIWPKGFDRTKHSGYIFMGRDETAYTDQYGRTHFSKKA